MNILDSLKKVPWANMVRGGIVAGATPNIAGGGATDVLRAMQASGDDATQRDMLAYNMKRQRAMDAVDMAHKNATTDYYRTVKPFEAISRVENQNRLAELAQKRILSTEEQKEFDRLSREKIAAQNNATAGERITATREGNAVNAYKSGIQTPFGVNLGIKTLPVDQLPAQQQANVAGTQAKTEGTQATTGLTNARTEQTQVNTKLAPAKVAIAQQNADRPRTGAHGAAAPAGDDTGLVEAIMANPEMFNRMTPTAIQRLLPELQRRGFKAPKKIGATEESRMAKAKDAVTSADTYIRLLEQAKKRGMMGPVGGRVQKGKSALGFEDPLFGEMQGAKDSLAAFVQAVHTRGNYQAIKHFIEALGDPAQNPDALIARARALQDAARGVLENQGRTEVDLTKDTRITGAGGSASGAKVRMAGPGGTFDVPADKVAIFEQNGFKRQ